MTWDFDIVIGAMMALMVLLLVAGAEARWQRRGGRAMPTGFCQRSRQLGCLRLAVSTHPLGKQFCSPAHAVTYACNLYQALYAFQRHHAARHGGYALVLATRARTVIPLGSLRGETEGHVCYSTWFAPRSITATRSGCLAAGVGCLFSEVDV